MSVDFIYTDASSYRAYLAGLHQREKLDIAIAKAVRAAVGAVAEIYGADRPLLREALRDFRYAPDAAREVITVNLYYACAALDPVAGDVVRAFQSLFDDDAAQIAEPAHGGSAGASGAEQLLARVRALAARQQFAEALRLVSAILVEYPAACARDRRFEWLRAALLAGIPGQPKSAAMVDLPAAERALLQIAKRAGGGCAEEAAAALVEAGRCAYADGRFADAKTHYGRALEHDPGAAEAHYQIARLARHAGRSRAARDVARRSRSASSSAMRCALPAIRCFAPTSSSCAPARWQRPVARRARRAIRCARGSAACASSRATATATFPPRGSIASRRPAPS